MTDETPRNDAGQFTSAEPLTGQAGIEADHGYKRMPEDEAPPEPSSDIMEEVKRLQESRAPADLRWPEELRGAQPGEDPVIPIEYQRLATGEKAPTNETVSLERAADDLTAYHGQQDEERARSVSSDFAAEIDKMRGDAIKDNPEIAKDLALSKEEIAAAESAKAEEATAQEPKEAKTVEPTADDPYADIPGLEPATREAMKNPQIRQAVEAEITKASETAQAYSTGLNHAQQFAQASLLAVAPELGNVPLDRWAEAVNIIAQSDPARGQQLGRMFQNVSELNQRQQLITHHQQQVSRQNFESYVKSEDARVEQLAKAEGIAVDNAKIVSYWESQGVSRNQFVQFCINNPAAASAEGRLMVLKAQRYDEMVKAAKPRGTKELPPVTRPGTSVHRGSNDASTKIAALEKQLASASGNKAIKIGAELMRARRG